MQLSANDLGKEVKRMSDLRNENGIQEDQIVRRRMVKRSSQISCLNIKLEISLTALLMYVFQKLTGIMYTNIREKSH